jgi:hypothetical protein
MYDQFHITEQITKRKLIEQLNLGKQKVSQLQVENEKDIFNKLNNLFGCANWEVTESKSKITATTSTCFLCNIAKKMNTSSPCKLFCLDPMMVLIKGLHQDNEFVVKETMWDTNRCVVEINKV